jgi:hypothetical protein
MKSTLLAAVMCLLTVLSAHALAQSDTTFSYQGELQEAGAPANGSYNLEFLLYDALSGGTQVGSAVVIAGLAVNDGVFRSQLDFGAQDYSGTPYWLEIVVNGTTLSPRQPITAAPYSIQTRGIYVHDTLEVGVGTTVPSQKLHVDGNARIDGWIGNDVDEDVTIAVNGSPSVRISYGESNGTFGLRPAPSIIMGSDSNTIVDGAVGSVIGGGGYGAPGVIGNVVYNSFSTISGGRKNVVGFDNGDTSALYATIGGGENNKARDMYGVVAGGRLNNAVGIEGSVISGGSDNSTIGGAYNTISGGIVGSISNTLGYSTISGGRLNYISGDFGTIPGGNNNSVTRDYGFAAGHRAISNHAGAFVWGGSVDADFQSTGDNQFLIRSSGGMGINTPSPLGMLHVRKVDLGLNTGLTLNDDIVIESEDSIVGLYSNGSGAWSSGLVLGEVDVAGALVDKWAIVRQSVSSNSRLHLTYGTSANYSSNSQYVSINNTGQVGLGIIPFFPLHMSSGAHCSTGGTWTNASSRELKENFEPVDRRAILGQLMEMPISRWNYKVEGKEIEHIGPMAEDFAAAFDTGEHDSSIATVDADGVAIASIQALYEIIQEKDDQIKELNARLSSIEEMLSKNAIAEK